MSEDWQKEQALEGKVFQALAKEGVTGVGEELLKKAKIPKKGLLSFFKKNKSLTVHGRQ